MAVGTDQYQPALAKRGNIGIGNGHVAQWHATRMRAVSKPGVRRTDAWPRRRHELRHCGRAQPQ